MIAILSKSGCDTIANWHRTLEQTESLDFGFRWRFTAADSARAPTKPALHASHGFCDFERGHHWVNHWHSDFSLYLLEKAEFDGAAEDDGFGTVILHSDNLPYSNSLTMALVKFF